MKRVFSGERDEHGILHLGSPDGSSCRHCGAGGIPVLSTDGRTCWWRVPLDCCDTARSRQRNAITFKRAERAAAAAKTEADRFKPGLPYKDQA